MPSRASQFSKTYDLPYSRDVTGVKVGPAAMAVPAARMESHIDSNVFFIVVKNGVYVPRGHPRWRG